MSEPDLFLRLCPAPTVGVTGTKGKTTTVVADPRAPRRGSEPPVVLGGNIGTPLVERLPELTPGHRVVIELSELQLPTLSRGTTVAVYTNVTADHLDRHGSLEAYRAVKRRLAELVDPDGAPGPQRRGSRRRPPTPGSAPRRRCSTGSSGRCPAGVGVVDGWIVAAGVERLPLAGGGPAATGPGGRIMPVDELAIPAGTTFATRWPPSRRACCSASRRTRSAARPPASAASSTASRPVAVVDGVRFVNDSQGTQPDAVIAALRAFDGRRSS